MKKTRLVLIALFIMFSTQILNAQEECTGIVDDNARLACYDLAFGAKDTTRDQRNEFGQWNKRVETSDMTDEKNVFLSLSSSNNIRGRYGKSGPAQLYFRCMENTTAVLVILNENFLSDIQGYGVVQYRLDKEPMNKIRMSASTDNEALGLWRGNQAIPFIKSVLDNKQLIIRATPYNESAVTATFDIRGIEAAIVELRETCNW